MKLTADGVETFVIPGIGHSLAELAPEELLAVLTEFLAPYRDSGGATRWRALQALRQPVPPPARRSARSSRSMRVS